MPGSSMAFQCVWSTAELLVRARSTALPFHVKPWVMRWCTATPDFGRPEVGRGRVLMHEQNTTWSTPSPSLATDGPRGVGVNYDCMAVILTRRSKSEGGRFLPS